jgi:hypothetical protein
MTKEVAVDLEKDILVDPDGSRWEVVSWRDEFSVFDSFHRTQRRESPQKVRVIELKGLPQQEANDPEK